MRGGLGVGRTIAVVVTALIVCAASAHNAAAYVTGGSVWPGGVIRYHNADPADASEIAAAVKAWNRSGAHVHFIATSAAQAAVTIVPWPKHPVGPTGDADGFATVGSVPRGEVVLGPGGIVHGAHVWLRSVNPSRFLTPPVLTIVAAHELGHVLGLQHSTRCATMDAAVDELCKQSPHFWQFICRVLQPDDIAGAVARYGGHARPVGPQYCDYFPAPGPPTQLKAQLVGSTTGGNYPGVKVTWTAPKGTPFKLLPGYHNSIGSYEVFAAGGHCSTASGTAQAESTQKPGATTSTVVYPYGSGPYCFAVEILDIYGRASKPAYVWLTVPGAPPAVSFNYTQNETDGLLFAFTDQSTVSGAGAHYAWNFGDSASGASNTSTQANPSHQFSAEGDYNVTETVTDSFGQHATFTQTVSVVDWTTPVASFGYDDTTDDVSFWDSSYSDDGGQITAWSWNFGDGTYSTQSAPQHQFAPGTYTVTLTVTDEHGKTSAPYSVTVTAP